MRAYGWRKLEVLNKEVVNENSAERGAAEHTRGRLEPCCEATYLLPYLLLQSETKLFVDSTHLKENNK